MKSEKIQPSGHGDSTGYVAERKLVYVLAETTIATCLTAV
jgi:hypothetical protein